MVENNIVAIFSFSVTWDFGTNTIWEFL